MKVILEAADLIRILGAHFGAEFDPENVTIKTDPFEVEVRGIPLPESERVSLPTTRTSPSKVTQYFDPEGPAHNNAEAAALIAARADANASAEPPPPGMDETDALGASGSPMSLIEQSKQLETELERNKPRRRRGGSSQAPGDFHDEVSSV